MASILVRYIETLRNVYSERFLCKFFHGESFIAPMKPESELFLTNILRRYLRISGHVLRERDEHSRPIIGVGTNGPFFHYS